MILGSGELVAYPRAIAKTIEAAKHFVFAVQKRVTGPALAMKACTRDRPQSQLEGCLTWCGKTIAACGLQCGNACPWIVHAQRTGRRAWTASSQTSQFEVRYFPKPSQIRFGVDACGFRTAVPDVITNLFQRKPPRHQAAGTGMAKRVRPTAWDMDSERTQTSASPAARNAGAPVGGIAR